MLLVEIAKWLFSLHYSYDTFRFNLVPTEGSVSLKLVLKKKLPLTKEQRSNLHYKCDAV
jgi:hypothetical protein